MRILSIQTRFLKPWLISFRLKRDDNRDQKLFDFNSLFDEHYNIMLLSRFQTLSVSNNVDV